MVGVIVQNLLHMIHRCCPPLPYTPHHLLGVQAGLNSREDGEQMQLAGVGHRDSEGDRRWWLLLLAIGHSLCHRLMPAYTNRPSIGNTFAKHCLDQGGSCWASAQLPTDHEVESYPGLQSTRSSLDNNIQVAMIVEVYN